MTNGKVSAEFQAQPMKARKDKGKEKRKKGQIVQMGIRDIW